MENPFEQILSELQELKKLVLNGKAPEPAPDIIDRATLCKRLKISEPTAIAWKKKIPSFKIGSAVRYDYNKVLKALEKTK